VFPFCHVFYLIGRLWTEFVFSLFKVTKFLTHQASITVIILQYNNYTLQQILEIVIFK